DLCAFAETDVAGSTRSVPSRSVSWTTGPTGTATCGRPALTGLPRSSTGARRCGRRTRAADAYEWRFSDDSKTRGGAHEQSHTKPDIQGPRRGRDQAVRLRDQELEDREHHAERGGFNSYREGQRAACELRARRSRVHGDGRRAELLILRRVLDGPAGRNAGIARQHLDAALVGRWGRRALWLAQRSIRRVVAGHPARARRDDGTSQSLETPQRHGGPSHNG